MTSRSGAALEQQVLTILLTRISALNARSILTKAVERAGLSKDGYGAEQLPVLVAALAPGCRLFLGDDATVVLDAIIALGPASWSSSPSTAARASPTSSTS